MLTELLNYLRPFWDKLEEVDEKRHVLKYTVTLLPEIQHDLYLLPVGQRSSLVEIEE